MDAVHVAVAPPLTLAEAAITDVPKKRDEPLAARANPVAPPVRASSIAPQARNMIVVVITIGRGVE